MSKKTQKTEQVSTDLAVANAIEFFSGNGNGERSGPFSIRLPKGLLKRLQKIADETGGNRNEIIIGLLERGLSTFTEEK